MYTRCVICGGVSDTGGWCDSCMGARLPGYAELVKAERHNLDIDPDRGEREYRDSLEDEDFEDPGGNSALRRATADNPRIYPCPNCGRPNRLTAKDVKLGYQCNECADIAEGIIGSSEY